MFPRFLTGFPCTAWRDDLAPCPRETPRDPLVDAGVQQAPAAGAGGTIELAPEAVHGPEGGLKAVDAESVYRLVSKWLDVPGAQPSAAGDREVHDWLGDKSASESSEEAAPTTAPRKRGAAPSSSSQRPAVPPAREGAPERRAYSRGTAAGIDDVQDDGDAVEALEGAKFAASGRRAAACKQEWWRRRAVARKLTPYPLTPQKLALAAALLKRGGYRSGAGYLAAMKRGHIVEGHEWGARLTLELRDCTRAVVRGIGPALQADPFPLDDMCNHPGGDTNFEAAEWPANPRECAVVGCWWLLREIEAACARVGQLTLAQGRGCGKATLNLPVSKADPEALGKSRTLTCTCVTGGAKSLCPVRAAHKLRAHAVALAQGYEKGVLEQMPLMPDHVGAFVEKKGFVECLKALAQRAGAEHLRITGHSMRVAGAQRMALAGLSVWKIQAFGRWGSDAVLRYVRDTVIEGVSAEVAPAVVQGLRKAKLLSLEDRPRLEPWEGGAYPGGARHAIPLAALVGCSWWTLQVSPHANSPLRPYTVEGGASRVAIPPPGVGWELARATAKTARSQLAGCQRAGSGDLPAARGRARRQAGHHGRGPGRRVGADLRGQAPARGP